MNTIRFLRLKNNLSAEAIANKLKVSVKTYYKIEKDKYAIKSIYLIELANMFNVSIDYLLDYKNESNNKTLEKDSKTKTIDKLNDIIL